MPDRRQITRHLYDSIGFNAGWLLSIWQEKTFEKMGKNSPRTPEMEYMRPEAVWEHEGRELWRNAVAWMVEHGEGIALFNDSTMRSLALLQASRAHRALIDDFGVPLGLAAPEAIVVDLYPRGFFASLEAVRLVWRELAAIDGDLSPDAAARMLENKFWTVGGERFVALSKAVDYQSIFHAEAGSRQDARRCFDGSVSMGAGNGMARGLQTGGIGNPVLVMLGLFPGIKPLHGENGTTGGRGGQTIVSSRSIKPFTRHDNAMFIFSFAGEMLLACERGLASVAAPAELSRAPEAVGMRRRWIKELDRVYVDAMADAALYHLLKMPPSRVSRYGRGASALVLYRRDDRPSHCVAMTALPSMPLNNGNESYLSASPSPINKCSLIPPKISKEYRSWASVIDIAGAEPISGLMEKRGGVLIDSDGEALERRIPAYLDYCHFRRADAKSRLGLTSAHHRLAPAEARDNILRLGEYDHRNIKSYAFKPFDNRYCYYSPFTTLWNDPRPELARQCRLDNRFVVTRPAAAIEAEGVPFFPTTCLTDGDLLRGHAYCIPLCLYDENDCRRPRPNLSRAMLDYLSALRRFEAHKPEQQAELIWLHVLAIGFSPAYLAANIEALLHDWPRIPFPVPVADNDQAVADASALLLNSSELGRKIAALLEPEGNSPTLFKGEGADSYSEIAPLSSWSAGRKDAKPFTCDSIALGAAQK